MALERLNKRSSMDATDNNIRIVVSLKQPIFRRTISAAVESEPDMQLIGATGNGSEAFMICEQHAVDLLVLDFDLEKITGIQLAEQLTKIQANRPIKVLGLIDFPQKHVVWGYLTNGVSGIVSKNRTQQQLLAAMRSVMTGEVVLDQSIRRLMMNSIRQIKPKLTEREIVILKHLAIGSSNETIAGKLDISQETLRNYLHGLRQKLPFVKDRVDMVLWTWVNLDQKEIFDFKAIDSE
ncbi:MAG: response regulator transcription factor [Ardenticatenaceae bacterium]|nr:response regulator transcription factor [Ardenticatenaceae bacterium]